MPILFNVRCQTCKRMMSQDCRGQTRDFYASGAQQHAAVSAFASIASFVEGRSALAMITMLQAGVSMESVVMTIRLSMRPKDVAAR